MVSGNYCKVCGHRILPNEPECRGCGCKTGNDAGKANIVLIPPVHDIGFFNFQIDFSPYINTKNDFKYEICSCGYLNEIDDEFCYMCGAKRSQSKLSRILKGNSKPKFSMDNLICECGAVNTKDSFYCEMCGKQLRVDIRKKKDNYSNFNREFKDSVFCFCGEENEKFSRFCNNCGLPLTNYGRLNDMAILCTCATLNEVTSDYCVGCGTNLKREDTKIVCVCGHKNNSNLRTCEECDKPLNPQRTLKTRIVCSCGEVLDWNDDFCPNCGKNIKRAIVQKNSINATVNNLKSIFR